MLYHPFLEYWCRACGTVHEGHEFPIVNGVSSAVCKKQLRKQERAKNPGKCRESKLRSRYGITQADFDAKLAAQGGKCQICGTSAEGAERQFVVDHCHSAQECGAKVVRGILCHHCNLILGHCRDDAKILLAAVEYLNHAKWDEALNDRPEEVAGDALRELQVTPIPDQQPVRDLPDCEWSGAD